MNIISGLLYHFTLKTPNTNMYLPSPGLYTHQSKEMGLRELVPSPSTLFPPPSENTIHHTSTKETYQLSPLENDREMRETTS